MLVPDPSELERYRNGTQQKQHEARTARIGTLRRLVFPKNEKHFSIQGLSGPAFTRRVRPNRVREATYKVVLAAVNAEMTRPTVTNPASAGSSASFPAMMNAELEVPFKRLPMLVGSETSQLALGKFTSSHLRSKLTSKAPRA